MISIQYILNTQVIRSILCYGKVYENIAKVNWFTIEPSNNVVKDLLVYLILYYKMAKNSSYK